MHDLLFNTLLTGGLTTGYLALERILSRRMRAVAMTPSPRNTDAPADVATLIPDLREALERFIQTRPDETIGREGDEFDREALLEGEIARRSGVLVLDRYEVATERPQEYRFIVNFTSACQDGLEVTQPYVTLLTKALMYTITELGHPVAINALGENFVVVKRFQDPVDAAAVEAVRVDSKLNLHQGIEAAIQMAEQESMIRTVSFYIVNGSSPIGDAHHATHAEFGSKARAYVYQVGKEGPDRELLDLTEYRPDWAGHLPRGYAGAYFVESVGGLKTTFLDFLQRAQQYR